MKHTVCVVTGTRAEFGLLRPLVEKLRDDADIELRLVVTGAHLVAAFGDTQAEIEEAGLPIHARIPLDMSADGKADMAAATGEALGKFARFFASAPPDLLVVLGDRFESFGAAAAAALQGIPVAHIHGGEVTEGAVDDFLRHAMTKMSRLHFTSCAAYRRRVIQLGEDPARVFDVGALGVENIVRLPVMSREDLSADLGFALEGELVVTTLHPVTQERDTAAAQVRELIAAMDRFPEMRFLITKANADAGGRAINEIWDQEARTRANWRVVASLGARRYLSALRLSRMMLGNSSSGVVEAPALGVPTVNIGDRQKGRMMAESVICCPPEREAIVRAMRQALSPEFRARAERAGSPFGRGETSALILREIKAFLAAPRTGGAKAFYDVPGVGLKS